MSSQIQSMDILEPMTRCAADGLTHSFTHSLTHICWALNTYMPCFAWKNYLFNRFYSLALFSLHLEEYTYVYEPTELEKNGLIPHYSSSWGRTRGLYGLADVNKWSIISFWSFYHAFSRWILAIDFVAMWFWSDVIVLFCYVCNITLNVVSWWYAVSDCGFSS